MDNLSQLKPLLEKLETNGGASSEELTELQTKFSISWPNDYLDCIRWSNGLEGYVYGRGYIWLWNCSEVLRLNKEYCVSDLAPGLVLIGSDAAALGYGFDCTSEKMPIVSVEMAAMHWEYCSELATSFIGFIKKLATESMPDGENEIENFGPPDWLRGKVIHERKPIVLGGSPYDPDNRVLIPREDHPKATVLFARILHHMLEKE